MLMVACLLMTSGERGVSVEASSVFKSCSGTVERGVQPSTAEASEACLTGRTGHHLLPKTFGL